MGDGHPLEEFFGRYHELRRSISITISCQYLPSSSRGVGPDPENLGRFLVKSAWKSWGFGLPGWDAGKTERPSRVGQDQCRVPQWTFIFEFVYSIFMMISQYVHSHHYLHHLFLLLLLLLLSQWHCIFWTKKFGRFGGWLQIDRFFSGDSGGFTDILRANWWNEAWKNWGVLYLNDFSLCHWGKLEDFFFTRRSKSPRVLVGHLSEAFTFSASRSGWIFRWWKRRLRGGRVNRQCPAVRRCKLKH